MISKEKYLKRIAGQETDAIKEAKQRVENRKWLRSSKKLALKILIRLDELEWTQKTLSLELGVTPQYVNKLLKGNVKFGFDILVKLQDVLSMPIFADYKVDQKTKNQQNISKVRSAEGIIVEGNFGGYNTDEDSIQYETVTIPLYSINEDISWVDIKEN